MSSAELYDYMDELAQFSAAKDAARGDQEEDPRPRASELDMPLDKEDVTVVHDGDRILMAVEYTVPVEFPGYTYKWHFHHELDRPIFIV